MDLLAAKCKLCDDLPMIISYPNFHVRCSCGCVTPYRIEKELSITDWLTGKIYRPWKLPRNSNAHLYEFIWGS